MLLVDGVWSLWGEWSNCSFVMCGVGNRTRSRSCDSPPPSVGGKNCEGEPEGSEGCDDLVCSSDECKDFCMKVIDIPKISSQKSLLRK